MSVMQLGFLRGPTSSRLKLAEIISEASDVSSISSVAVSGALDSKSCEHEIDNFRPQIRHSVLNIAPSCLP